MNGFYLAPKNNPAYEAALKRCAAMDRADKKGGFSSPQDCDYALQVRTCISALLCGLEMKNNEVLWESLVLLQQLHQAMYFNAASDSDGKPRP